MSRSLLITLVLAACSAEPTLAGSLTDEDARALAAAASDEDFVVPMNDVIKASLDRWTTDRREFATAALARKPLTDATIVPMIAERGLPSELIAVAFVESGFLDVPARPERYPAAGVWQFIVPTARDYGLRVDDGVDERRDLPLATDAAMRLLGDLHDRFGDWGLAFAGYNQGHVKVQEAIEAEGTSDPYELIARGALYPYAAEVMSAVIVLESPEALGFSAP